jgi:hypothetical protein
MPNTGWGSIRSAAFTQSRPAASRRARTRRIPPTAQSTRSATGCQAGSGIGLPAATAETALASTPRPSHASTSRGKNAYPAQDWTQAGRPRSQPATAMPMRTAENKPSSSGLRHWWAANSAAASRCGWQARNVSTQVPWLYAR